MKDKIVYLAIPYTWSPEKSFKIANEIAANLMSKGYIIFSPVSHSHVIADELDDDLRTSQEFWMKQDLPILSKCDRLIIIDIGEDGMKLIEESKGCQSEIAKAKELGLTISYIKYE